VTKLFDEEVFPVCSPELIDEKNPLQDVQDLNRYALIHDDMQMSWESWARSAGSAQPLSSRGPKFSHSHMALQAALNGEGIVLGRSVLAMDYLESGRLVRPVNISIPAEHSYYLLCQERMVASPKIKAFSSWLLEEARVFRRNRLRD